MTSTKTVLFEETETVMSRTMQVPIFRIPETQNYEDNLYLEDKNSILNLKASIFGEDISDLNKKRHLMNEEPEVLFRSLFDKDSKEFKRRIRQSSKLCKSYICSKKVIADSDDENFWRSSMKDFNCVGAGKKTWESKKEIDVQSPEKDSDSDDVYTDEIDEENIFNGNIKVTIKDKPVVESREQILETLRICFEAFKINAQESRRIQELKTKIQEKMAKRRLRRCFNAWRNRVTNVKALEKKKKEEREMSNERKIELFVNAIAEKQKELSRMRKTATNCPTITKCRSNQRCQSAPDEIIDNSLRSRNSVGRNSLRGRCKSNSQTRFQVQRKIIEEQRFKLAEQNRIIEEMKLREIERDARRANKDTIDAAKGALAHCGGRNRRSLMHLMRENGCRDESLEPLRIPNTPDFLVRMEARAEARRERVRRSEEARFKKIEDEKRKEEELRKKEELERKRLQREAQREAKRLREEREERRIREIERIKFLNEKADQFYNRLLLRRYIFEPLISLLNQKYNYTEKATNHYNDTLLRKTFIAWKLETEEQKKIKEELAISVYERNLLWSSLSGWKKYTSEERQKYDVASDFYDMKVQAKTLKIWWLRTFEIKALEEKKEEMARDHYEYRLKMRFFYLWRRFPEISDEVKESERQKREWRELVQRVIPDFDPRQRGVAIDD